MTYRTQQLVFGVFLVLSGFAMLLHTFDASYVGMAQDVSVGPMFFPRLIISVWIICACGITLEALKLDNVPLAFEWGKVLAAVGVLALFALCFPVLGFLITGVGCFAGLSLILGYKRKGLLLIISAAYVLFVDFTFRTVLQSYLPTFSLFGA